ncbi:MAG: hypothetical protein KKI09_07000 [Spirochaetes bacterium]|nr:hypothetical protein [Spirochaetota bacterium]MBU0955157.1 hypothetical protein [Spirochaetota bacterium]
MLKVVLSVMVLIGFLSPVFSQNSLPDYNFASGTWNFIGSRLHQEDEKAGLAKLNIHVPQNSKMIYSFNARYESGAEDGHAGFGVHLFADTVHPKASWGNGESWLLWLNYDEKPVSPDIPAGFSAQVYRSRSHSRMDLVQTIDLNQFGNLITSEILAQPIPIRIWLDGETGEVRIYDPIDQSYYYYFYLESDGLPLRGDWIALRTNGVHLSFGLDS